MGENLQTLIPGDSSTPATLPGDSSTPKDSVSPDGNSQDATESNNDAPFHEHPRWKEVTGKMDSLKHRNENLERDNQLMREQFNSLSSQVAPPSQPTQSPVDYDRIGDQFLTDPKSGVQALGGVLKTEIIEDISDLLEEKLNQRDQRNRTSDIQSQVTGLRSKYDDFEQYESKIADLASAKTPIEDMYLMQKLFEDNKALEERKRILDQKQAELQGRGVTGRVNATKAIKLPIPSTPEQAFENAKQRLRSEGIEI